MKSQLVFRSMIISSILLALIALFAPWAMADDETDKVKIEIKAPLEAVDCLATLPTITVLGLNIDISTARIEGDGEEDEDGDDDDHTTSQHSDHEDLTCAALAPGQLVEVKLASDLPDPITGLLSATKVVIEDGDCEEEPEVEIEGPIQAVDQTALTVTVLGLVIDISQAKLEGEHDEDYVLAGHSYGGDDNDCDEPPLDISQLIAGQFVEIKLASSVAPLVATELEVKNFDNEVEVEVEDDDGNVSDDVEINVAVTTKVKKSGRNGAKTIKKVVRLYTVASSGARLRGLPTGKAKIAVTRVKDGSKSVGTSAVKVESNGTKQVRVRLKKAR